MTGGVVMALGNATLEGTVYGAGRPAAQPVAPRLQAPDRGRRARDRDRSSSSTLPRTAGRAGRKGVGEPPIVPTAGAVANAIARATGARVRRLPMTPERVWRAVTPATMARPRRTRRSDRRRHSTAGRDQRPVTERFAAPATLDDALALLARDARHGPIAGGTDLVVAARQGRKPLPESIVAIDRIAELEASRGRRRLARARAP